MYAFPISSLNSKYACRAEISKGNCNRIRSWDRTYNGTSSYALMKYTLNAIPVVLVISHDTNNEISIYRAITSLNQQGRLRFRRKARRNGESVDSNFFISHPPSRLVSF